MSLSRSDIQILKEVFQPEFDRIDKKFEQLNKRFDEVDQRFDKNDKDHQIFLNRFDKNDKDHQEFFSRFDKNDKIHGEFHSRFDKNDSDHELIITQLIAELHNLYTPREDFDQLKKRVTVVEKTLHKLPS